MIINSRESQKVVLTKEGNGCEKRKKIPQQPQQLYKKEWSSRSTTNNLLTRKSIINRQHMVSSVKLYLNLRVN